MERKPRTTKKDMIDLRTKIHQRVLADMNPRGIAECSKEEYHILVTQWKDAAKECGFRFYKGRLYSGNNRSQFPFIYVPATVICYPNDLGEPEAEASGGSWVYVFSDPKGYRIQEVLSVGKDVPLEAVYDKLLEIIELCGVYEGKKTRCISFGKLRKLLECYAKKLGTKVILGEEYLKFSGWHKSSDDDGKMNYRMSEDTILNMSDQDPLSIFDHSWYINTPLTRMLFSATLFSIVKPLLTEAKLPTDFLLCLKNRDMADHYYYFHRFACFYCNPKVYPEHKNMYKDYRDFEQNAVQCISPMHHNNFPQLFRKTYAKSNKYAPDLCFSRAEAKTLKKSTALPILLSPIKGADEKPVSSCLEVSIPLRRNDLMVSVMNEHTRQRLFAFYAGFIDYLCEDSEAVTLKAEQLYVKALNMLNGGKRNATARQKQVACLLTAVYLAEEYVTSENPGGIDQFARVKMLLEQIGRGSGPDERRTASVTAFADFLQELINKQEDPFPLLLQDEHYLYLDFKAYWDAFVCYCKEHGICIQESHKGFRRKHLAADYLKPQYEQKQGQYARYDYRKIIGGKKETVLAVKKLILEYARSSAKAGN